MGEDSEVVDVDNARVGSVHASHFESVRPQLVRTKNVSGDVSHHKRY